MNQFAERHIGPRPSEIEEMLQKIGVKTLDELVNQTIPANIRLNKSLDLPPALNESELLDHMKALGKKNKNYRSYIGMGYYNTVLPGVIQRNILENPGWYTAYTPYQAEIAQGRLEALLNYQTMVTDLTGMEIANASLLDEGTAAAEAMILLYNARSRAKKKAGAMTFLVAEDCFPQTIDVLKSRATPLGIELIIINHKDFQFTEKVFGCLVQYPAKYGEIHDYRALVEQAKEVEAGVAVAADLLSLTLLTPPGEWGADVVIGTTQRFGIPMGYGGPHAAYFATKETNKRNIPGRIMGVTVDAQGKRALRMALQTREQHIKREKATSNICTAQVLLAVMAGMYGVYHGPKRLKKIAKHIHALATKLSEGLSQLGYTQINKNYFDTIQINIGEVNIDTLKVFAEDAKTNFNYIDDKNVSISLDEKDNVQNINDILNVFAKSCNHSDPEGLIQTVLSGDYLEADSFIPDGLYRESDYMQQEVFNTYHSETDMMRYIKRLENKDLALNHSMIALGSCTMKLNAASELFPLSWSEFGNIHPFVPINQARGYQIMLHELEEALCEITGFDGMSLQPNSGAQGEYTGLMVIRAYHMSRGDNHRNICIIPASAHGTNPASAVMAGMKVVVTKCDEDGNIDLNDLRDKAEEHSENLAALMITYPSTHGVFEESVIEVTDIIHQYGGQVYMDGANMNAQVGLTNPATIGADVCHLNLHKTFAIPHGGGGPGMGPIGVVEHLKPFLPGHQLIKTGGEQAISSVSAAPWGSSLVLTISYAYIKMLGTDGLTDSTKVAILNANYMKECLKEEFNILYTGPYGRVAHEMILDCRPFKANGIEVTDIAKRLMDYGFHAPTVSFPVAGTTMVEPTESESKAELDRFIEAMKSIRAEIEAVANGTADKENNVLKNAPHTLDVITNDEWIKPYSRSDAAFPIEWVRNNKFWPSVSRVDDAYGDRNLVCTCDPIESYVEA
ncbi:MAG: glycine dehydrogenase (aminomethyl-transferring) [Flavobacteriales bacterium]|nr:glycine dehydrogenase (aminomethyl-transferring) [Flavobacteriales bacterium]